MTWDIRGLKRQGTEGWRARTGVQRQQGQPYVLEPGLADDLSIPLDPGVNLAGWINPFSLSQYQSALNTTNSVLIAPANLRRSYLILQNQGPGNAFIAFGASAVAPTATQNASCLQLSSTQFYEQVGGGSMNPLTGMPAPGLFVTPDYIQGITDAAGTTVLVLEGVFMLSRWANVIAPNVAKV
jgi:hypothetical protein